MEPHFSEFVTDVGFSIGFPLAVFLAGATWNRVVGATNRRLSKSWATFCLLLPIMCLTMTVWYHFENCRAVWLSSPVVFSGVFALLALFVPAALIWLVVRVWQDR
jgi:biotin transporter BioY